MNISPSDLSFSPEQNQRAPGLQFREQLESGLDELKTDVTERPYLWLAIAFIAGFVSHTFPVRILFLVLMKLVTWLAGPFILLMGVIKISDWFVSPRRQEPTILQRP
jgi:hypothetical protein